MPADLIAIVGSETLLGREIRERLVDRGIRAELQLFSAGNPAVSSEEDEPVLSGELTETALEDTGIVILAGSADSSAKALSATPGHAAIIDTGGALEDMPEARMARESTGARTLRIVPHPAALALSGLLRAANEYRPIRHAVVVAFEPASERGQAGINELQQQTSSLLSFRPLEKQIFDAQLSFTMLPRYGSEAAQALEAIEQRIERHLATLLEGAVPIPSLRLVQAPVFHGHSFSLWIQFDEAVEADALADTLARAGIDVRSPDLDAPTNVGVAGQSVVSTGLIEADRNHPRAIWVWAVSDNIRLAAEAVVDIVKEVAP